MMEDINNGKSKKKSILFLIVGLFLILNLTFISAQLPFDNTIDFDKNTGQYGKYEIRDWFGLLKLQDLELISNTETCKDNKCRAEIPVNHYQDGIFIEDIRFIDMDTNEETEIKNYQLKINGENYNIGDEILKGDFNLEITGDLFGFQSVDWQIKTHGQWLDSWAVWTDSLNVNLTVYYSFDINTTDNSVTGTGALYDLDANEGTPVLSTAGCLIGDCLNITVNNNLQFPQGETIYNLFYANHTYNFWAYKTPDDTGNHFIASTDDEAIFQWSDSLNRFGWQNLAGGDDYTTPEPLGRWVMITTVVNDTRMVMYINGTKTHNEPIAALNTTKLFLGTASNGAGDWVGRVDEFGIWNRTLSASEVSDLYNSGSGLAYVENPLPTIVTLNSPANDTIQNNDTIRFTSTLTVSPAGLHDIENATVYIWFNNQTLFNATTKVITGDTENISMINITGFIPENYLWNVRGCFQNATTATCVFASENRSFSYGAITNKINWNATIYETETGTFTANITAPSTYTPTGGLLYYNGTQYSATITASGDEHLISRSFDIPEVPSNSQNRSFHFSWDLGNINYNSSTTQQNVTKINFGECNSSMNNPYINFTFREEENSSIMSARIDAATWEYWLGGGAETKTLIYSNATVLKHFPFCFSPSGKTLNNNLTLQYSTSGYPQRIHVRSSDLTDTTTQQILYLLGAADGIYSSIQVVDNTGDSISEVTVQVERQFSGVWTLISQDETDSSGLVTFWVNPDYEHRFTFTKTDCTGVTQTIRPTQSTYTQTLTCVGDTTAVYITQLEGIRYTRGPRSGILNPGLINFTYTLFSEKDNIAGAKFKINHLNGTEINSTTSVCAASGCTLSLTYTGRTGEEIVGTYYVNIGNGLFIIEADAFWRLISTNVSDTGTIKAFWQNFRTFFEDWHEEGVDMNNKLEYSRIVFIFMILAIGLALFNRFTGSYDGQYPGAFALAITALIWMGSLAGGLTGQGFFYYSGLFGTSATAEFMNNYILAILSTFMSAAIMMATARRLS